MSSAKPTPIAAVIESLPDEWRTLARTLAPYNPGAAHAYESCAKALEERDGASSLVSVAAPATTSTELTWRERFWLVPVETRIGVVELSEALSRPRSYVYRHTSKRSGLPLIPHRRLDGELIFVVGEVREWLRLHEDVIVKAPSAIIPLRKGA